MKTKNRHVGCANNLPQLFLHLQELDMHLQRQWSSFLKRIRCMSSICFFMQVQRILGGTGSPNYLFQTEKASLKLRTDSTDTEPKQCYKNALLSKSSFNEKTLSKNISTLFISPDVLLRLIGLMPEELGYLKSLHVQDMAAGFEIVLKKRARAAAQLSNIAQQTRSSSSGPTSEASKLAGSTKTLHAVDRHGKRYCRLGYQSPVTVISDNDGHAFYGGLHFFRTALGHATSRSAPLSS